MKTSIFDSGKITKIKKRAIKQKSEEKQSIKCYVPVGCGKDYSGDLFLPPNDKYILEIDYPLDSVAKFEILTGENGIGSLNLISKICKFYENIYKDAEKYGIWGHDIFDLQLCQINIDHKTKQITIGVDS